MIMVEDRIADPPCPGLQSLNKPGVGSWTDWAFLLEHGPFTGLEVKAGEDWISSVRARSVLGDVLP